MNIVQIVIDDLSGHFLNASSQGIAFPVKRPSINGCSRMSVRVGWRFVGSLWCVPAPREMLVGIQKFLGCPWSRVQTFDNPSPWHDRRLRYVTQLTADHLCYVQHGNGGHFTDVQAFDFIRGQEVNPGKSAVVDPAKDMQGAAQDPKTVCSWAMFEHKRSHILNRRQESASIGTIKQPSGRLGWGMCPTWVVFGIGSPWRIGPNWERATACRVGSVQRRLRAPPSV